VDRTTGWTRPGSNDDQPEWWIDSIHSANGDEFDGQL